MVSPCSRIAGMADQLLPSYLRRSTDPSRLETSLHHSFPFGNSDGAPRSGKEVTQMAMSSRAPLRMAVLLLAPLIASGDTFLARTSDGGRTWTDIDPGPPLNGLKDFAQGPGSTYYAWAGDSVLAFSAA